MDPQEAEADHARMAKKSPHPPKKHFLGPWLARLKIKKVWLAQQLDTTEGHISNLCSYKKGASLQLMLRISDAIGVPMNDLYRMPPRREEVEALQSFNPATINKLMNVPADESEKPIGPQT